MKTTKRGLVFGVMMVMLAAAWCHGAVDERSDGTMVADVQDAPKDLDWGPEVAGTRLALEVGNFTSPEAKLRSMDAWVYVMNAGNWMINFDSDSSDMKFAKAYTKNAKGDLVQISPPVNDGPGPTVLSVASSMDYGSDFLMHLPPNKIYRFSVKLSPKILQEVRQQLFVGVGVWRVENGVRSKGVVYSNGEPSLSVVGPAAAATAVVPLVSAVERRD